MERNDAMVEGLVRNGAIVDRRIEDAFRRVLRHWFLPDADPSDVYRDAAIVTHRTADGIPVSSSSQPAIMARMLAQLELEAGHRVLEIGTGTGYNAALLSLLVGGRGEVVSIDVNPDICAAARRRLADAGASNVTVLAADGWAATQDRSAFDRIEATVGVWDLSRPWVEQLTPDGVIVAPLWLRAGLQASVAFRKVGERLEATNIEPCGFMRLIGPGAGAARYERIGPWTVSLDQPNPERITLLADLLQAPPSVERAPLLPAGWFTPIALRHSDAIQLFAQETGETVNCYGILDAVTPGLAVVASCAGNADTVRVFGAGAARGRLFSLIEAEPPIDLERIGITGIRAGESCATTGALAVLTRPNFTFLLRGDRQSSKR